jgi:uncharacterized membrane protein
MDMGSSNKSSVRISSWLSILGGAILCAVLIYGALHSLFVLGIGSLFQELSLSGSIKVFLSLYMFLGLSGVTLMFAGSYFLWKGYSRVSLISNSAGVLLDLLTLAVLQLYDVALTTALTAGTMVSAILVSISVALSLRIPMVVKPKAPLLSSVEIATVSVFSAIYAIAILIVVIPSPTGGYTHIGDVVVFIAALLFGYRVGGLVGIIGAVVADLYTGYSRWFVSILAHGLEGAIAGFAKGRSLVFQVIMCVLGGFLMASTYFLINIFIKGFPLAVISYVRDLFAQAAVSMVLGIAIANVIKRTLPQLRE